MGQTLGVKPMIIKGEDLRTKGFGGLYGVGKAAIHSPALVVLSHTPAGATESTAWVGKGIVYDTGGLSIKTKVSGSRASPVPAVSLAVVHYESILNSVPIDVKIFLFCGQVETLNNSLMYRNTVVDYDVSKYFTT